MNPIIRNTKIFRSINSCFKNYSSQQVTPYSRRKIIANTITSSTSSSSNSSSKAKLLFFRMIRAGRIVFISFSIYQVGYSQGFIDYAKNPEKMHHDMINAALKSNSANNIYTELSPIYRRVHNVFKNVLCSCRHHVRSRVDFIEKRLNAVKNEISNSKEKESPESIPMLIKERYYYFDYYNHRCHYYDVGMS